jgi:hypothetical protein
MTRPPFRRPFLCGGQALRKSLTQFLPFAIV